MASRIGKNISVSIFGQSHSAGIGCVVEGIPAGKKIDLDELQAFLSRRAPGGMPWSTPRKEADLPEFWAAWSMASRVARLLRPLSATPIRKAPIMMNFAACRDRATPITWRI